MGAASRRTLPPRYPEKTITPGHDRSYHQWRCPRPGRYRPAYVRSTLIARAQEDRRPRGAPDRPGRRPSPGSGNESTAIIRRGLEYETKEGLVRRLGATMLIADGDEFGFIVSVLVSRGYSLRGGPFDGGHELWSPAGVCVSDSEPPATSGRASSRYYYLHESILEDAPELAALLMRPRQ